MKNLFLLMVAVLISCGGKADTIPTPPVVIPDGNCGVKVHTLQVTWSFSGTATGYNFYVGNEVIHTFLGGSVFAGNFDFSLDKCGKTIFTMTAVNGTWESPHSIEYCAGLGCDGQYGLIEIMD